MKQVVGTLFFKDKKLLIDKPRKRATYQMIGGSVEENESIFDAAIRECKEELGDRAIFDPLKIKFLMEFDEIATSDPNLKIHMNIFIYDISHYCILPVQRPFQRPHAIREGLSLDDILCIIERHVILKAQTI